MADSAATKHAVPAISDLRRRVSVHKKRHTMAFLYDFMLASIVVTVFFAFSPFPNSASPWLINVFSIWFFLFLLQISILHHILLFFPLTDLTKVFSIGSSSNGSYTSPTPATEVPQSNSPRSKFKAENRPPVEAKNNTSLVPGANPSASSPKSADQVSPTNLTTTTTAKSLSDSDSKIVPQSNQTTTETMTKI